MPTDQELQDQINKTHKEGVGIWAKIKALFVREKALERLNAARRKDLQALGHIVMYDTITLNTVPLNPQAVAGYVGGNWPTFALLQRLFPRAKHLSIAVN